MQRRYLTKPHKEVLTGSLPTVSKGSGKTIVFIPSSEWTEIVPKQKWETINEIQDEKSGLALSSNHLQHFSVALDRNSECYTTPYVCETLEIRVFIWQNKDCV